MGSKQHRERSAQQVHQAGDQGVERCAKIGKFAGQFFQPCQTASRDPAAVRGRHGRRYAQATGKAALVNLHTAAGLGNAMGNIESAWYNHAPNQTREMLLLEPYIANAEPTMVPHPYVKWSYEPARAEDVPAALVRAYAMAVQPPAGPVLLSIPMGDADKPCLPVPDIRTVTTRLAATAEQLAPVAAMLDAAKSPVLVDTDPRVDVEPPGTEGTLADEFASIVFREL